MNFDRKPDHIEWYYGEIKPQISANIKIISGLPSVENIRNNSIIIIDDLFVEASKSDNITNLFTRVSHHRNCFIIFITQNIYHQSSHNRTRNLNTQYLVLFKNPRDKLQIQTLKRQMCIPHLVEAFDYATTSSPFSYLFIDFRPETLEHLRVQTGILNGENHLVFINN